MVWRHLQHRAVDCGTCEQVCCCRKFRGSRNTPLSTNHTLWGEIWTETKTGPQIRRIINSVINMRVVEEVRTKNDVTGVLLKRWGQSDIAGVLLRRRGQNDITGVLVGRRGETVILQVCCWGGEENSDITGMLLMRWGQTVILQVCCWWDEDTQWNYRYVAEEARKTAILQVCCWWDEDRAILQVCCWWDEDKRWYYWCAVEEVRTNSDITGVSLGYWWQTVILQVYH